MSNVEVQASSSMSSLEVAKCDESRCQPENVIKASGVGRSNAEHGAFELSVGIELAFDCREDGRIDGM